MLVISEVFLLVVVGSWTFSVGVGLLYLRKVVQRLDYDEVRESILNALAVMVADLLEHPKVQDALSTTICNGINRTMEQPDLGERLVRTVSETRRKDNLQLSRALGEQLPSLATNFLGGAIDSIRSTGSKSKKNKNKKNLIKSAQDVSSLTLDDNGSSSIKMTSVPEEQKKER